MFNNQIFKSFVLGFLSVFKIRDRSVKSVKILDIAEYFCKIENDINKLYQELKEDERN